MKKAICVMALVLACCAPVSASANCVQRGFVYDVARDNLPYQWAAIGTEDGYTIIVDRTEYNIDVDNSVYVCLDGDEVVSIEQSALDFSNICRADECYVIENIGWREVMCHVSYIGNTIKLTAMYGRDVWYTDAGDWVDVVPDITDTVIVYADKTTGEMLSGIVWGA